MVASPTPIPVVPSSATSTTTFASVTSATATPPPAATIPMAPASTQARTPAPPPTPNMDTPAAPSAVRWHEHPPRRAQWFSAWRHGWDSDSIGHLSITNTSKVNYCQALPALLSYIPDSVEFEGRLCQAEPSAPPPTTTTPPPLLPKTKRERFRVHTTLPAHNIIPHRPPDGRIALLPQQDHPSHRPALNARLYQRATPICLQLLVLVSQGRQPAAASLPPPHHKANLLSSTYSKSCNLMRLARGLWHSDRAITRPARTHSSGSVPCNHRKRIAHKLSPLSLDEPGSDFEDDALTTRRRPQ
ncbi:hypothetical protein EDB85DRAFT_2291223 [Lactarius pseudohatsudake]|nr:hypothetical protein EDB85DRAFT_2291223 [Lactarius pseudohatsudake]